jgi:zinc transport system ATP-binding protein
VKGTAPVIQLEHVRFSRNGEPVLDNVNLTIPEGDFTALIGPNGGGKTTLIRLMVGLLRPDDGRVRVLGRSPRSVSTRLGYVDQQVGVNPRFPISVLDVVLMGRLKSFRRWPRHSREDKAAARRALEGMEMWDFRNRHVGELSGGQYQRVMIARALATDPEILFLDEPTASVDTKHQAEFYEILKDLNRRVTIVIVCHDLMMINAYVKSVACVNRCVHYHNHAEVTQEMIDMYQCPVELVAHGLPHRVLREHPGNGRTGR